MGTTHIDETLFERYLDKNAAVPPVSIKDKLGIKRINNQLLTTEGPLCSYLIKHLEFMAVEIYQHHMNAPADTTYNFYFSEYNFKIDNKTKTLTKKNKGADFIYPNPINSVPHSTIHGHFDRSIYQNVCDILRIVAEFNAPPTAGQYVPFPNSKDYIDIFDGRPGITDIHRNFSGFIHEYCMNYKDENKLLELCKDILNYVINDKNVKEVSNLIDELDKILGNLRTKPKGIGATAFNIHDLL